MQGGGYGSFSFELEIYDDCYVRTLKSALDDNSIIYEYIIGKESEPQNISLPIYEGLSKDQCGGWNFELYSIWFDGL
jgi:hypothetical protein